MFVQLERAHKNIFGAPLPTSKDFLEPLYAGSLLEAILPNVVPGKSEEADPCRQEVFQKKNAEFQEGEFPILREVIGFEKRAPFGHVRHLDRLCRECAGIRAVALGVNKVRISGIVVISISRLSKVE